MGVIGQIVAGGNTTTIGTTASIVDGIKSAVAQMVASNGFHVRPTGIYANPVLLDLIDREMKTEFNVVLNTDSITGGVRVKMLSTQAGDLPLIPDWSLSYTGTPGSGTAVLPAYIVTEDLIEYHWLGDPTPRIFQLGMPGSLASQYVAVKFGAVVVKEMCIRDRRRAINVIKDRIASMDWQVRVRRGVQAGLLTDVQNKLRALRRTLEEPNSVDSFRTLMEQVIEDALTGGYGAIEMEPTGDPKRPAMLWPVDGASIRINARWDGEEDSPRYAQTLPGQLESSAVELCDNQLIYVRMNPRSFTPFGLGPLEVAFETVNQFLSAHRFAGKLAANAEAQYALWLNEASSCLLYTSRCV